MNLIENSLIKVLREFGVIGLITYAGGVVLLIGFLREPNLTRQILLGIVSIILLFLAAAMSYYRMKIQKDREKALVEMVQNTGNRLTEQLGKNLTKEQVVSITQTIWQNQKDLIEAITKDIPTKS